MTTQVAIRLDDREGYADEIPTWIKKVNATKALVVKHTAQQGENIHYHMCLTIPNMKVNAIRMNLGRHFTKGKGNTHHSVKEWDGDERALSYLFHDEYHKIITSLAYSKDDIERFKENSDNIKDDLKKNGTINTLCKAVEKLRERYPNRYRHEKQDICDAIWDVLKEQGNWYPNKFQLERWIMKVQADTAENEHDWECVKKQWYADMFR